MKLTLVAGARPNFMKISPIISAINEAQSQGRNIDYRLVHTGQHFDKKMSQTFFQELNIPEPDINLECGGGSQAEQTAAIMIKFERELLSNPTDLVIVVGDVTSTLACAIVAQKLHTKVAHVEAGIRSGDWTMPEEINRMVVDAISNYFFTTTQNASETLIHSGIPAERVFLVGNTMIDTLVKNKDRFKKPNIFNELNLIKKNYFVLTLHRPSNVDEDSQLMEILNAIDTHVRDLPVVFPVHPRTKMALDRLNAKFNNIHLLEPLGYLPFNYLVAHSKAVITDSGGITEETTYLGIPCMTLRDSTERPETCTIGTNELLGTDPKAIVPALNKLFSGRWKKGDVPEYWDGKTSQRIVDILLKELEKD